ncbi:MAG: hypothetical protein HY237_08065 [Acidobacteria bacterium]|nr:hypothetical protein [Acidobacteriota bacterium]
MKIVRLHAFLLLCMFTLATAHATPQASAPAKSGQAPDPTAVWKALWQPTFDASRSASVKDLTLVRDRIRITLADGIIQFANPVNDIIFAATFRGHGRVQVAPPNSLEAQQLRLFTKQDALDLEFSEAVFHFLDDSFAEVSRQVQFAPTTGGVSSDLYTSREKEWEDAGAPFLPRLFKGILSYAHRRTSLFAADLKTTDKGWTHVRLDALDQEEVTVGRWAKSSGRAVFDNWISSPAGGRSAEEAYRDPFSKEDFVIGSYRIEATVNEAEELRATSRVAIRHRAGGERVLLFDLDPHLRVDSVRLVPERAGGDVPANELVYFQARDPKDRSQSYGSYVAVGLPGPTHAADAQTLVFRYAGKHLIRKVGNGSFFCQSYGWYPSRPNLFAVRAQFDLTFRSPKKYALVATGNKVSEDTDGEWSITTWKTEPPIAVAGFAFGDYKVESKKAGSIDIDIYANRNADEMLQGLEWRSIQTDRVVDRYGSVRGDVVKVWKLPVGTLSPATVAETMATEMANALAVFEKYFGRYPYKRLAVTNIPYFYGQGWPGLIYLSGLSFLDSTQRNNLRLPQNEVLTDAFRAHESSHQWWGHRVGWKSYHDQWLSEGFAQFSGNLYVHLRENMKNYLIHLRGDKQNLLLKDQRGRTYESLGPVWMGHRLSSSESPAAYSVVVYHKGGYILHMLRMMLYDPSNEQNPETRFQAMMRDFCDSYDNKAASTEDFKAIVEKHMAPAMDIEANHRMDWFFNQYVYGTGIPEYEFRYTVQGAEGKWKVTGNVVQRGVPDGWKDILPLYLHASGKTVLLGWARVTQRDNRIEFTLPARPERISLNDYEDILAEIKQ